MTGCASWSRSIRAVETRVTAGRSASWSTCRGRSCGSARSPAARSMLEQGRRPSRSTPIRRPATPRASICRIRKSSQAVEPGQTLLLDDGKVRLRCDRDRAGTRIDRARRGRRQAVRPQGRQPARHRAAVLGADRRRTAPISKPRSTPASTGSALSFVQRPEDIAEAKKITRGRAAVMAKIEKPQAVTRLDEIIEARRRADGGARRSRRRNAAREGAGHPEADHPRGAPRRQAGGGRDADAGIDDLKPGADARRGLRRRDRDLRRRRRHHAVGGIGRRANIRSRRSRP